MIHQNFIANNVEKNRDRDIIVQFSFEDLYQIVLFSNINLYDSKYIF